MQFILSKNSNGHLVLSISFYIISSNFTTQFIRIYLRQEKSPVQIYADNRVT